MMRRSLSLLIALPLLAPALQAQLPAHSNAPAPAKLPWDSTVVRALLADAFSAARQAPVAERSSLLAAVGRTQVLAHDYSGASRTLRLVDDEPSPIDVARQLGEPALFAGLDRANLARRLSCALREDDRPDDALAVIRGMRPGKDRDWELEFAAVLAARGSTSPFAKTKRKPAPPAERGRAALRIASDIRLPAARLDALIGIAGVMPDTGPGRAILIEAYDAARRITLADTDRQRSRDAMLATVAVGLRRTDDVRSLFARLTDIEDIRVVVAVSSKDDPKLARELAPRAIAAGRAIRDSAARAAYLVGVWQNLRNVGGRAFADSLLPEWTNRAEHPIDLRAMLDSAAAAHPDSSPLALAQGTYGADKRAYLRAARIALLAASPDSAMLDDQARDIAMQQFQVGDDDEGAITLDLIRDPDNAAFAVKQWGNSTLSHLDARTLRGYADRFHNPVVRDMVLEHVIDPYLTSRTASPVDVAWARALADSIATPEIRRNARRALASRSLADGDSVGARRQLLALLGERALSPEEEANSYGRGLQGDLIRAGGWRDAIEWAHGSPAPAGRARRLIGIAAQLQRSLDVQERRGMIISNGPDWCVDEF